MYERGKQYDSILMDCPWPWTTWSPKGLSRSPESHYHTLSWYDIFNINFEQLLKPNAAIYMWATFPLYLHAGLLGQLMNIKYVTAAHVWVKLNTRALTPYMGMGKWTRANAEPVLLFTKGSPKRIERNVRQIVMEPRERHSKKPNRIYSDIERLTGGDCLELFARQTWPGWDAIGDEIDGRDIRTVLGYRKQEFDPSRGVRFLGTDLGL